MAPGVSVLARVEPTYFVVSAVLFFSGFLASYPTVKRDVSLLTWYPLWVWRRVRKEISPEDPWHCLFVFLLVFNSVSLLVNFVSGFFVFLPPVFAFLLGMNIGVISIEEAGTAGLLSLLFNPVAWIELPAAWISLAIGIQLGTQAVEKGASGALSIFPQLAEVYLYVVFPLLVGAALLEATLIRLLGGPVED